ncbi:SRPBCC family protein [Rhodotorula paludigena]|uniref:SRPBCC family protein n=1 Tax=Rhodotorula paludigena TaxID=86838 RepID=UPI00317D11A0
MSAVTVTRLVNPTDASLVLSVDQLWAGLAHKARNPAKFLPIPIESRVTEDTGDKIVRYIKTAGAPEMKEVITSYLKAIIYFDKYAPGAAADAEPVGRVTNSISYGPAPSHDLYLSFSFAPSVPGVSPDELKTLSQEQVADRAGLAVEKTLEAVRDMVRAGDV